MRSSIGKYKPLPTLLLPLILIRHCRRKCRRIDSTPGRPGINYSASSDYDFPSTKPSTADWQVWEEFWLRYCLPDGKIPRSLGKWRNGSHRKWEWFYDQQTETVSRIQAGRLWHYKRVAGQTHTRGNQPNIPEPEDATQGQPATVELEDSYTVVLLSTGPLISSSSTAQPSKFWDYLQSLGGEWMWDHVRLPYGLGSVVEAVKAGEAVFVTDGSYNRTVRKDVCSAGWVIYSERRKKVVMECSFCETSFPSTPRGKVACDNLGGLNKARQRRKKVPPRECTLASQRLPLESAAVFYGGKKIRSECGKEIRYQVGRAEARSFYLSELGWFEATFDSVDWEARDKALDGKPDMFKAWLSKQSSTFCASGVNMGRWFGSPVTCCPNCLKPDEDSRHLMHCTDIGRLVGRIALFRAELDELYSWLRQPHTHPGLAAMVYTYLYDRGSCTMASSAPNDRTLQ